MEVMKVYIIVGFDYDGDRENILACTATWDDADKFVEFYRTGMNVADFDRYDDFDIQLKSVITFEGISKNNS